MGTDDFWSVERLIPKRNTGAFSASNRKSGIPLSELEAEPEKQLFSFGPVKRPKNSRTVLSYRFSEKTEPENDALLQEFKKIPPLSFVPCQRFSPTFETLLPEQKRYFFYFCQCIGERRVIPISYSYLQLYLCRMIRKMKKEDPIPEDFFWLWENYRKTFPLADKLFSDTVTDLSLYFEIDLPWERLGPILTAEDFHIRPFLLNSFLFDYLFSEGHSVTPREMNCILKQLTGLSFRNSKAYRCNALYATTVEEALEKAFRGGLFNRRELNDTLFQIQLPSQVRTIRKMFCGLCQKEIFTVEVSLISVPFLHDENIRSRCDELVRYVENRIRAILKMKNCLSRVYISSIHRDYLETILLQYEHLRPSEEKDFSSVLPEKEKRIPARVPEVELKTANEIEEESWRLTKILTEAYTTSGEESVILGKSEDDEAFDQKYASELKKLDQKSNAGEFWEFAALLTEEEDLFLRCAVNGGKIAAARFAQGIGAFPEGMCAVCNAKALDTVGDGVFDEICEIYPEYLEELKEVFPPIKGE